MGGVAAATGGCDSSNWGVWQQQLGGVTAVKRGVGLVGPFKYTKPLQFRTTPALKDNERHIAVPMKAKEALVRKSAFPKPSANCEVPPNIGTALTEEIVAQALMTQVAAKAPGPDKINFRILQMLWNWDKVRITDMFYHAIRLGYYPKKWKKPRGILLEKGCK